MSKTTRRIFLARAAQSAAAFTAAARLFAQPANGTNEKVGDSFVSEFRPISDPITGRKLIQLTSGDCFDMPMYYFIPTFGSDQKTIVFYRYRPNTGEIQLYKINIDSGTTVRLTEAKTENSLWRPYLQPSGFGVRDLLSAVNPVTNEVIYFDTNEIRAVHLETFADRIVGQVPDGRVPSGLTGVSPNGKLFCYPHFDRKWWEAQLPPNTSAPARSSPKDSKLVVLDLTTGETTELLMVNFWITHANFYDDHRVLFCHGATEHAILMTDLRYPGQYESLRTRSARGAPNHYNATRKGVMYEMLSDDKSVPVIGGIYDPDTRARREYKLDISRGRLHIGRDPEARLWFFETGVHGGPSIVYFPRLASNEVNKGMPLMSSTDYRTYSNNQRSHFHPSITPDRKHILFTGGDSRNQTNHLFLLDISDLNDTVVEG